MDVDISTTNLHAEKRALSATEVHKLCNICMDKVVRGEIINALQCNHIYHHQCIIDWIRMNLKCPTCRDTISLTTCSFLKTISIFKKIFVNPVSEYP
ncbi:hypothetical protein YC2023_059707 [Brassica napus]